MISRRDMLKTGACAAAALALPRAADAQAAAFAPKPGAWRDFEVATRLDLPANGKAQAWIPLPSVREDEWIKPGKSSWETNALSAEIVRDPKYGAELLHLVFKDGETAPRVEVRSGFSLRDRAEDLAAKSAVPALGENDRKLYLEATELMPTDGIVRRPRRRRLPARRAISTGRGRSMNGSWRTPSAMPRPGDAAQATSPRCCGPAT